jgi:hypothetical protein
MRLRLLSFPLSFWLSFWLSIACTGLFAQAAGAQTHVQSPQPIRGSEPKLPELETDRPDITEASTVVMPGVWQLETGLLFQSDRIDPTTAHDVSAPNVLLRLGVAPRLELRIDAEGFVEESLSTPGTARASGVSDVELAIKYKLFDQEQVGLDIAIIPLISLPVGSDDFTSGGYDPTVKLTWSRDLARGFGLGGNVIVSSITEAGARFTQTAISASLGHGLGEGWGGFWELYGASSLSRDGGRAWLFDTGITHTLGANAQLDLSVGRGLTEDAPDWFIGVGFSIRGLFKR